jgi:hypothetical protein
VRLSSITMVSVDILKEKDDGNLSICKNFQTEPRL